MVTLGNRNHERTFKQVGDYSRIEAEDTNVKDGWREKVMVVSEDPEGKTIGTGGAFSQIFQCGSHIE